MSKSRIEKIEFTKKMRQLMAHKGMTQSDLGRASELGRDLISHYMRGVRYPSPRNLRKLAVALGIQPGELDPAIGVPEENEQQDIAEIKQLAGDPARVRIQVRQVVTMKQALAVMAILHGTEDDKDQS
jgi:transcriptional regulator with XRE-family HTH domain